MAQLPPKSHAELRPTSTPSTGSAPNAIGGPHFKVASLPQQRSAWWKLVRPRGTGYAVPEFSRACLIRLIDFPEMPFRTSVRETIKAGRSALLVRTELPIGGRMTSVAYKHVRRRNWVKRLTVLFRTNRILRTWKLGHELLARGIATARPLAVIVPRATRLSGDGFLISEWLEGAASPAEFLQLLRPFEPRARLRRTRVAAHKLGDLLGRMHARNISHRDLKPGNVLLQDREHDIAAYVVDLDGAGLCARVSRRVRIRDLSRLALGLEACPDIARTTRLRFLKSYLAAAGDKTWNWKTAWRDLAAATATRRLRKKSKHRK